MTDFESGDSRVQRPLPARLDPRAGRAASGSADSPGGRARRRSSGTAITARIVVGLLSAILLGTSGWGWYLGRVAEASVNRTDALPTTGNKDTSGHGVDMNLLLVGSDSRADATSAELKALNTQANPGNNTDTMILVHVPADGSAASFVSFPRDSYVQIPGHGWDKLNAAYAYGYNGVGHGASDSTKQAAGAQLLIQTISQLTGLQIDHYIQVDLLGFFKLSSVVGGVQVNLCAPVKDHYSGVNLPAGVQTISGSQALSFVRQRHGLPRGDLDRIVRQQTFIAATIRKMLSENVLLDLGKQHDLVQAAAQSLTIDQSLDLLQLAQQMQSVKPGNIKFQTIPLVGDAKDAQGRDILKLPDEDTLHQFFAQLSADPKPAQSTQPGHAGQSSAGQSSAAPQTVAPAKVDVEVYNGSGTTGLASSTAAALRSAGFTVTKTGNADSQKYTHTEIRYAAGDEALATTLAAKIPGATTAQQQDASPGSVQLVLGSDFKGLGQAVTPSSPAPSQDATDTPRTAADTSCIN